MAVDQPATTGTTHTRLEAARTTYAVAADAFLDLVAGVPLDRYDGPGLGDWDLRSLVGHTGRSLTTVVSYLATRADRVDAESPGAYFATVSRLAAQDVDGQIRRRGVEAGQALGADPVGRLRESRRAAEEALVGLGGEDVVVGTAGGGMRVSDYLPTRTFELVVHSLDIARAAGVGFTPPPAALVEALTVATESALELGVGVDVLLALTGRQPLPAGCSVVP